MIYKYEECDLFCVPSSYYLVQCISADFAMGAGIAVQFNKHFNVKENLKRRYGNVIAEWDGSWTKGFCVQDGRVFNLVTKRNYFHKPTEETMRNALFDLREQAKEQRIKMLAMPKIGAGLDKCRGKLCFPLSSKCSTMRTSQFWFVTTAMRENSEKKSVTLQKNPQKKPNLVSVHLTDKGEQL